MEEILGTCKNRKHYLTQIHTWVESKCNFEDLKTTTMLGLGWNPVAQCMVSMILSPAQPLHTREAHEDGLPDYHHINPANIVISDFRLPKP